MNPKNERSPIAIIGEGKMAIDCLARAIKTDCVQTTLVVTRPGDDMANRRLVGLCEKNSIQVVETSNPNDEESISSLKALAPVAIFNINSFSILKPELICLPPKGVVNFHNGPLPLYAGLNIPTWVIWNGEKTHGVTWHFVDAGIDSGDLIAQRYFDVDTQVTAIGLTVKCIMEGIKLFDQVLVDVVTGQVARLPQTGPRSYYRKKDIPSDGFIDFGWPAAKIGRLIRALDFHPMPNPLVQPRIKFATGFLSIGAAAVTLDEDSHSAVKPGEIVEIDDDDLIVGALGGRLSISSLFTEQGEELGPRQAAERYSLQLGVQFT